MQDGAGEGGRAQILPSPGGRFKHSGFFSRPLRTFASIFNRKVKDQSLFENDRSRKVDSIVARKETRK